MRAGWLTILAFAAATACGGPDTIDPGPTQSVQDDFAGTDDTGNLHVHVDLVQNGRNITLKSPCVPQDYCRIFPYTTAGMGELGSDFQVDINSLTGTFADPGITFTFTTTNGKTFTFTGTVAQSKQMIGTLSGPTHPASRLQLDLQ
jgi:hypothetical protein